MAGGWVIIHMMSENVVTTGLSHPEVIVASDGVLFVGGSAHPRGAGTFARVLGRYVRERGTLTFMDALGRGRRSDGGRSRDRDRPRDLRGAGPELGRHPPRVGGGTLVVRDGVLVPGVRPGKESRGAGWM